MPSQTGFFFISKRFSTLLLKSSPPLAVLGFNFGRANGVELNRGGEFDACARLLQLAIDAQMVAPEGPGPGDGDAQLEAAVYFSAPLPSTALRQRP